jgi:hypothetical protein
MFNHGGGAYLIMKVPLCLPFKEKLQKTDWLIDQIVYKLYGLTEEEIKLVEEVL